MDVQLKELIETIKSEGIEEAEIRSAAIVAEAEVRAKQILADAEREAEKLIQDAKQDSEKQQEAGREALRQASRDLLLKVDESVRSYFEKITTAKLEEQFSGDVLVEWISGIVKGWLKQGTSDISVLIPEKKHGKLEKALRGTLAEELKKGVEIKPFPGIESGFRILERDGSVHYEFSPRELAELLCEFMNPRLSRILQEVVGE